MWQRKSKQAIYTPEFEGSLMLNNHFKFVSNLGFRRTRFSFGL